jgi:hypothetical protein
MAIVVFNVETTPQTKTRSMAERLYEDNHRLREHVEALEHELVKAKAMLQVQSKALEEVNEYADDLLVVRQALEHELAKANAIVDLCLDKIINGVEEVQDEQEDHF